MVGERTLADPETKVVSDAPSEDLSTGALVGDRYEIRGVLGVGGMGVVYRAFDRQVGELVALKTLQTEESSNPDLVGRFRREVRLARRVTHTNTARVYDLGNELGRWFLTMELVDGESLQDRIDREPMLSVKRSCEIAADVCAGLTAIHDAGVVHRDLKPGNVLLERGGRVLITDFGIARQIDPSDDDALHTRGMIGTPRYMAPEQVLRSREIDERADIYALGVMLFRMLTGEFPGRGLATAGGMRARQRGGAPDPRDVVPVPEELAELVRRCLALEPGDRPRSAADCSSVLTRWSKEDFDHRALVSTSAAGAPPDARVEPSSERRAGPSSGSARDSRVDSRSRLRGPDQRTIVVLPFRVRGRQDDDYLAEALAEELADVLSRTRGLWVISGGTAAAFSQSRDSREIGRSLGADVVVDGTIQRSGDRLRTTARLFDVVDGLQLWSGRFDGDFTDVFEIQDRMARQIAEALRVELSFLTHSAEVPAEALECYLRGRQKSRGFGNEQRAAVELFERCLEIAPDFKPALAALAFASLRAGFFEEHNGAGWCERATAAVERACVQAPELVETQIAVGVHELQRGDYPRSARALLRAVELAPTCAVGHLYLGLLKAETGFPVEGEERLKLACELDSKILMGLFERVRMAALMGNMGEYERLLVRLRAVPNILISTLAMIELRVAGWTGDRDRARRVYSELAQAGEDTPQIRLALLFGRAVAYEENDDALAELRLQADRIANPRLRALLAQLVAEVMAIRGQPAEALEVIRDALSGVLVDIVWLEHCPVFGEVRRLGGYAEIEATLRRRARAVWV